jgi:hypothetical protein
VQQIIKPDWFTRLTVRHISDTDDAMAKMIRDRWPIKLQALASTLGDER